MNLKPFTPRGVVAALAAIAFLRSTLGGADVAPPSTSEGRSEVRTDDSAPMPSIDPKLLARLRQLQADRRADRVQARKDPKSWEESRAQRASAHRAQLASLWGSVAGSIDGQARLRLHAERMARLNRMLDLAEPKHDSALVKRIQADIERELTLHTELMMQLQRPAGMQ